MSKVIVRNPNTFKAVKIKETFLYDGDYYIKVNSREAALLNMRKCKHYFSPTLKVDRDLLDSEKKVKVIYIG